MSAERCQESRPRDARKVGREMLGKLAESCQESWARDARKVFFVVVVNSVLHVATFKGGGQPFLFLYMGDGICGILLCRVLE